MIITIGYVNKLDSSTVKLNSLDDTEFDYDMIYLESLCNAGVRYSLKDFTIDVYKWWAK